MSGRKKSDDICSAWNQGCAVYNKWADRHGINRNVLIIFYALGVKKEMTQKSIADYYAIPKQSINGVIRKLRQEGYIQLVESEDDKREKKIRLTQKGKEYSKEILVPLYQIEDYVFHVLGEERVSQMIETMRLFSVLFEKETERNE